MSVTAAMRAAGPLLAAWLFAWSLTSGRHAGGHYFVFILCTLAAVATSVVAFCTIDRSYNTSVDAARTCTSSSSST